LHHRPAAGQSAPRARRNAPSLIETWGGMGGGNSRRRGASLWHIGCSPLLAAARVRIRLVCSQRARCGGHGRPRLVQGGKLSGDACGCGSIRGGDR
jgi:hypothetical protein